MKYDEEKLWIAVITQAIKDSNSRNEKLKKTAIKWINSRSFEAVCDLTNLDYNRLKNLLNKIGINKEDSMISREIKSLLINNLKELSYLLPKGEFYQDKFYIGDMKGDKVIVETTGERVGNWYNLSKSEDVTKLLTVITGEKKNSEELHGCIMANSAFPARQYLSDQSPMPEDIISPRILTPGGLLLLGGDPKVGKTDLLLSWLAHMSAGLSFLGFTPAKPLKIFYLQTDIEYHYIKERLQQLNFDKKSLELVSENLVITPKTKLLLDSEGIEKIKDIMSGIFDIKTVDIIAIDTLRGIFDFNQYEENSNSSMFCFLKDRIEKLRAITNPNCGIILTHNTKKVSKRLLVENPFQSFSGASALRSFYTTGVMMIKPTEQQSSCKLIFELGNGKSIPAMQIEKINGHWCTVAEKSNAKQCWKKKYDIILQLILKEALKGNLYNISQFCNAFEYKAGLESKYSICRCINDLATKGYIKFHKTKAPRSNRLLCVKNMKIPAY